MKSLALSVCLCAAFATAHGSPRHLHLRRQNSTASILPNRPVTSLSDVPTGSEPSGFYGVGTATNDLSNSLTFATTGSVPLGSYGSGSIDPYGTGFAGTGRGELTTLTVLTTSVHTIISCAPTVSSCPAASHTAALSALPSDAVSTVLVTDVIVLTSTVCPVTAAHSISSSVSADAASGKITGTTLRDPLSNIVPSTLSGSLHPHRVSLSTFASDIVTTMYETATLTKDRTITLTRAEKSGDLSRTITSVVLSTFETVITNVVSHIKGETTTIANSPEDTSASDSADLISGTITLTATRTGYQTITLKLPSKPADPSTLVTGNDATGSIYSSASQAIDQPGPSSSPSSDSNSGDCECRNNPVTVTLPAKTIYVTVTQDSAATSTYQSELSSGTESSRTRVLPHFSAHRNGTEY